MTGYTTVSSGIGETPPLRPLAPVDPPRRPEPRDRDSANDRRRRGQRHEAPRPEGPPRVDEYAAPRG